MRTSRHDDVPVSRKFAPPPGDDIPVSRPFAPPAGLAVASALEVAETPEPMQLIPLDQLPAQPLPVAQPLAPPMQPVYLPPVYPQAAYSPPAPAGFPIFKLFFAGMAVTVLGWFFAMGPGSQLFASKSKASHKPAEPTEAADPADEQQQVAKINPPATAPAEGPGSLLAVAVPETKKAAPRKAETPKQEAPKQVAPPVKLEPTPIKAGQADATPVAAASTNGRNPLNMSAAIDREIEKKLAASNIPASPLADDAEFMRRVYLDISGKIPSASKAMAFLDSKDPGKRGKLIDELLASSDYGTHFSHYWRDLLVKRDPDNNRGLRQDAFAGWLAGQFNKNDSWDKTIKAMMTAQGKEADVPETFFILANQDNMQPAPNKIVGTVGNLFMGIQLQCAECHVHPFNSQWSRNDFWGMAAFFGKVRADREAGKKGKGAAGTANITEVGNAPKATGKGKKMQAKGSPPGPKISIPNPNDPRKTDDVATAKFFKAAQPSLPDQGPYRNYAADWVGSSKNPYFAPATANRMWAYFFSRGFVNPIDDMRPDNPATHPELLKLLGDEFTASGYDLKHLIRAICNSKTYQRTSRPLPGNANDETLYSKMTVKVMTADMLLDSLAMATGQASQKNAREGNGGGKGGGGKKGGGPTSLRQFFDTQDYDADPSEYTYGIPQVLRLMNSYLGKKTEAVGRNAMAAGSKEKAIEKLYLTALARRPSQAEVQKISAFVGTGDPAKAYADVFWTLLNSAEFVCNH